MGDVRCPEPSANVKKRILSRIILDPRHCIQIWGSNKSVLWQSEITNGRTTQDSRKDESYEYHYPKNRQSWNFGGKKAQQE